MARRLRRNGPAAPFARLGCDPHLFSDFSRLLAVLPPPEEIRQVGTAIGASRAEQQREQLM